MLRLILLPCICIGVLGCGVRAPISQYTGASITQSTPEAIVLSMEFDVSNTNEEPLQLIVYEYTVTVGGYSVYRGKRLAEQTVPRLSTVISSIPVVIQRDDIVGAKQVAWQMTGTLGYIPPTELAKTLLKAGLWKPTTSIHAHGSIVVPPID